MKHLVIAGLLLVLLVQTGNFLNLVQPIPSVPEVKKVNSLQEAAIRNGLPNPGERILTAISLASKQTGLSEPFLLSLMWSESSFHTQALSSKQYQGLMQIPKSSQPLHREEDVNTLIGAKIFLEKLRITNGDYQKALILYKGWALNHPEGKRQANKVLNLARKLRTS